MFKLALVGTSLTIPNMFLPNLATRSTSLCAQPYSFLILSTHSFHKSLIVTQRTILLHNRRLTLPASLLMEEQKLDCKWFILGIEILIFILINSIPVAAGTAAGDLPTKKFTVPAGNAPLWFYCGQVGHCAAGMVFAINPPADPSPNSFSAFKALAMGGAAASSSSPPPASSSSYVTPPAPHWVSATATVTYRSSVYTTTYTSYDGTPRMSFFAPWCSFTSNAG